MVLSNFDSQIQSISGLWFSKRFEKRACRLSDIKLLQFILMIFIVGVFCFADYWLGGSNLKLTKANHYILGPSTEHLQKMISTNCMNQYQS
jgi:hypothetical protein